MLSQKCTMPRMAAVVVGVLLIALVCQPCESRRVDCTKFVFAPKCRGVAAKRGITPYFRETRLQPDRLSKMVDDVDESALFERPYDEVRTSRHARTEPKPELDAGQRGSLRTYLRMRLGSTARDAERREDENEGGGDTGYNSATLLDTFQKAYRQARRGGYF